MLGLGYNPCELCYLKAAKRTFGATDAQELCQKIDVRYSYGEVSNEKYRDYYSPNFWQMRKVSWILSVPLRLIGAIAMVAYAVIDALCKDQVSSKIKLYCAARFIELAAGDLISIADDRIGQNWSVGVCAHVKLYFLANQAIDQRQNAFNSLFRSPLGVAGEQLLAHTRNLKEAVPPWFKLIRPDPKDSN